MHIDLARLRLIAERDDAILTDVEFAHLNTCSDCFRIWVEFIELAERRAQAHRSSFAE